MRNFLTSMLFLLTFGLGHAQAQHGGHVGGSAHMGAGQVHNYSHPASQGYQSYHRPNYNNYPRFSYGYGNGLFFGNVGYPLYNVPSYNNLSYGFNGLGNCNYPYGSRQYAWCFFRTYGYYPY